MEGRVGTYFPQITVLDNRVGLPDSLRARFAKLFDLNHPPVNPFPGIDNHYVVEGVQMIDEHTITAEVKVSYSGCRYTFVLRDRWTLAPVDPTDCWIS
jgi:hypothetical protein